MKQRPTRRTPRFNPLSLKKSPERSLPKSGLSVRTPVRATSTPTRTPLNTTPLKWWQKLNPLRFFGRRKRKFSWKRFLAWTAGTIAVFLLIIAGIFIYFMRDLPDPKTLTTNLPTQSTKILDRNGNTLYSIYGEQNRTIVTSDQISNYVKQATVATEDATFYQNDGFDLSGIARAIRNRITGQGLTGGGSTITQQYIKNALLTSQETLTRKIKELILAIEVDQIYTKDQILTGYLNQIPYGSSAYGIEAASETYFGVHAKDLTLSEAATLAAIPQLPTYYSPYGNHLDALFARKNYVLGRMVTTGAITQAQADQAEKDAPTADNPNFVQHSNLVAPHFVFYIREQLINWIGGDPKTAEETLDNSGYTVYTTLDINAQNMAQGILSQMGPDVVKKYNATNACLTAVNPKNGEVIAMVGSIDYNTSKSGNTNFCTSQLQPGSSFKPFVYATDFDSSHKDSPSSVLYDVSTDFGGGYTPADYDGKQRGPVTIRSALDESLNIPAVKALYQATVPDAIATAKKMGITTLTADPSTYGLSLVLGSGEVEPVQMASAYGAFANGGLQTPVHGIMTIQKNGKVVKDYTTTQPTQVIDPDVAYEMNSILSDNASRAPVFGTKNSFILPDRPVAAKSGTTQNYRDAWTVGYTPQISVAVWVGNNDPGKTMVSGADGSFVAAPIWNKFMSEYLKGQPVETFTVPSNMQTITVDKLSGKLPTSLTPQSDLVTDIFAPWQVPTTNDDVHVSVNIDKTTGSLATSLTPASDIVPTPFTIIHSEEPNLPNWEQPVQAWAQANGFGAVPPTATDTVHTTANQPTISFATPTNGSSVNGTFTLRVDVGGPRPITQVEYFINNVSIGVATSAPWQISYTTASLPAGSQTIQATVTNDLDLTANAEVTVTKGDDTTPPGPVNNPSFTNGSQALNTPIHLSWTDPTDADLASVNVYVDGGTKPTQTVNAVPSAEGDASISGLPVGSHTFTLKTVDKSGNENPNGINVTAQVLP